MPPAAAQQQGGGGVVRPVKIGAIFEGADEDLETAFRRAVDRVNVDRTLLSRSRLEAEVFRIKPHDSFHAAKVG